MFVMNSAVQNNPQIFCFIIAILLVFQPNYYEFSESVSNNYYGSSTNAVPNLLRFRDFEPRSTNEPVNGRAAASTNVFAVETKDMAVSSSSDGSTGRKARGFHFHAENDDIKIGVEFVVPFVRIPIQPSMKLTKSTFRNLMHLNEGSLLMSGVFIAAGAAAATLFKVLTATPVVYSFGLKKSTRASDGPMSNLMDTFNFVTQRHAVNGSKTSKVVTNMQDLLQNVHSKFLEHDIDIRSCIQKSICEYVKDAVIDVRTGKANALAKIIDGLTSLDTVHDYISGTALHKAIDSGKSVSNCEMAFTTCKWTKPANKLLEHLIKYLRYLNTG